MTTIAETVNSMETGKEQGKNQNGLLARKCATTGMAGSLIATVFSGLGNGKVAHFIHPWAGVAFVGFAIWHTYINVKENK